VSSRIFFGALEHRVGVVPELSGASTVNFVCLFYLMALFCLSKEAAVFVSALAISAEVRNSAGSSVCVPESSFLFEFSAKFSIEPGFVVGWLDAPGGNESFHTLGDSVGYYRAGTVYVIASKAPVPGLVGEPGS